MREMLDMLVAVGDRTDARDDAAMDVVAGHGGAVMHACARVVVRLGVAVWRRFCGVWGRDKVDICCVGS